MGLLRGLLLDNLGLKLAALLLAVVVYLNVFTERPATMVVSFPLQFSDLADSLSLAGPPPVPVQAELRGTGKQLIRLWLTEPSIKVSLAGVEAGHFERDLSMDDLPLMTNERLEVQRMIGPMRVELRVEQKITRHVAVAPRVSGAPKSGAVWSGTVVTEPSSVAVTGPREAVAAIDSIPLEPVSIAGRRDTTRAHVKPEGLPDWCTIDPPTVAVIVPIESP